MSQSNVNEHDLNALAAEIKAFGLALGFQQIGITDINLELAEQRLQDWLAHHFHGEMHYMEKHGLKRSRPAELVTDTCRVISVRMDYLPPNASILKVLRNKFKAFISRYALGRDYHKVLKKRLEKLAQFISEKISSHHYRVFVDSAPVMEKALAEKSGLGWIGKHTNLINAKAGSWFFLGSIYTNIPLPIDHKSQNHCGSCQACIDICPTEAIVGPYQLDARKCISYLTIEYRGIIPEEFREKIGNRIYGCDDCQLICPWNKFAKITTENDFLPRHNLADADLLFLFNLSEQEFLTITEGSAMRRINYEQWLRNLAIALGNAPASQKIISALEEKNLHTSPLVKIHIAWALEQQFSKLSLR